MAEKKLSEKQLILCKHCKQEVQDNYLIDFCCHGCKQVYEILNLSGLSNYYEYRELDDNRKYSSVKLIDRTFDYFDEVDFLKANTINQQNSNVVEAKLFLTGIQCTACVWLIQKLPKFCKGVKHAELNFKNSVVNILFDKSEVKLSYIAIRLSELGYLPKPYNPSEEEELRKRSRNLLLIQLGVAGFCAGNTMLLAVSLYQGYFSGIKTDYLNFIHIISFLLTLPVLSFSAQPFFKAAFASLKLLRLHIDVPISIGIISAFLFSTYNLFFNPEHVYFDSICMLVFLLLSGRFLQKIALEKAFKNNDLEDYLLPQFARVKSDNNNLVEKQIKQIKLNDVVVVKKDEIIPLDGKVVDGSSSIDNSFLTGESKPIEANVNKYVFAGGKNLNSELLIEVQSDFYESRIYKLISVVKNTAKISDTALDGLNKFTNFFVLIVFVLVSFCFLYWFNKGELEIAITNCISILIITCPCALGLARPIVIAKAVSSLSKKGIILKRNYFFNLLPKIKNFYFDKTGTITNGSFIIRDQFLQKEVEQEVLLEKIYVLEESSNHPIKSAFNKIGNMKTANLKLKSFEVLKGLGISGVFNDNSTLFLGSRKFFYSYNLNIANELKSSIKKLDDADETQVFAFNNQELLGVFVLSDTERFNIIKFLDFLSFSRNNLFILSGDLKSVVLKFSKKLGFKSNNIFGELLPEEKAQIVENDLSLNCMIGDGVNDAPALKKADLSIGVGGSSEVNLLVADCFISKPSTESFLLLFQAIKSTNSIIRRNVFISIIYNIIGSYLAFYGVINPLIAAILMPISSFTVIVSSLIFKINKYKSF